MNAHISKSVAILTSKTPYFGTAAKDALDVALIFGSFEQPVSLFFQGEAVRQLIAGQDLERLGMKNYLATYAALPFYDIEQLYVCEQSLKQRGLTSNFHVDNVTVLAAGQFASALQQHDIILRF